MYDSVQIAQRCYCGRCSGHRGHGGRARCGITRIW
jgi:hypothetical protein